MRYTVSSMLGVLLLPMLAHAQVSIGNEGSTFGLGTADLESTVINVVQWVLGFLGLIAVLAIFASIIVAATAKSDERASVARKALVGAIVGLVVILLAWAIVTFVVGQTNSLTN